MMLLGIRRPQSLRIAGGHLMQSKRLKEFKSSSALNRPRAA
jgi:hypothetical protein